MATGKMPLSCSYRAAEAVKACQVVQQLLRGSYKLVTTLTGLVNLLKLVIRGSDIRSARENVSRVDSPVLSSYT